MENTENTKKIKWYSIPEAAEYLDVGEQTLYRWMREGKITFRKVGDSTRFWQEDLNSVMQVSYSTKDLDKARDVCPVCRHTELVEGAIQGTGLVYFVPRKTKFWTLKSSFVGTTGRMCTRCGAIAWYGDTAKLAKLRLPSAAKQANEPAPSGQEAAP